MANRSTPFGWATGGEHWLPRPGQHELTLANAAGEVIDHVIFDVRAF